MVVKRMLNYECFRMFLGKLWRLLGFKFIIFLNRFFNLEIRLCFLFSFSCLIRNLRFLLFFLNCIMSFFFCKGGCIFRGNVYVRGNCFFVFESYL